LFIFRMPVTVIKSSWSLPCRD